MDHDKIKTLPIETHDPNYFEGYLLNMKTRFRIKYSILFPFYMCGWIMVFLFFSADMHSSSAFGFIFSFVMLLLGWWLITQFKNNLKINPRDIYFKVSSDGLEYTMINEFSGKINHRKVLWCDVVKSCDPADGYDIGFYRSGGKYSITYLFFYISKQLGADKKILIPVNEIMKYKNKFHLMSALLYNIATKPLLKLNFSEEIFYYFNVNPVNFSYKKKSIKRILARIVIGSIVLFECLAIIYGGSVSVTYYNISFFYIFPVIIIGILLSIASTVLLADNISFLKPAENDYNILNYKRNVDASCKSEY